MYVPFWRQLWVTLGVFMTTLATGMELGYPSALLPALRASQEIHIDAEGASWIGSSVVIAFIPSFLVISTIMDKFGRRAAFMVIQIPGLIGWLIISQSTNVTTLIIGKIIGGMGMCNVFFGPMMIGEYSNPKYRGMFLSSKSTASYTGFTVIHILGRYFEWRTVAYFSMVPFVMSLLIAYMWKESPHWLIKKNRFDEAETNFYWLRGKNQQSMKEFRALCNAQENRSGGLSTNRRQKIKAYFKNFRQKSFLKPISVYIFAIIITDYSGKAVFPVIALDMVKSITGKDLSHAFYYVVVIDVINIVCSLVSCTIVKLFKRRRIIFGTGFVCIALLLLISAYVLLVKHDYISKQYYWIPVALLVAYFVVTTAGNSPLITGLPGEIIPLQYREEAAVTGGIFWTVLYTFTMKTTFMMMEHWGVHGVFTTYACVLAVAFCYLYKTLPETKDRTLQEIEDFFNRGYFADDNIDDKDVSLLTKPV